MEAGLLNRGVRSFENDLLIIGGGVAGLQAAVEVARRGLNVTMLTKRRGMASTWILGFNVALEAVPSGDSPAKFFDDTMIGGGYVNNEELVAVLAYESVKEVRRLEELGLDFRCHDGSYPVRLAAGNRYPRTIHFEDRTGPHIMKFLRAQLSEGDVEIRNSMAAVRLIKAGPRVVGALAIDLEREEMVAFFARATVLATGGAGNLYSFTTNPRGLTGDGYALALRAGAQLIDMEFVQFEPFILVHPPDAKGYAVATTLVGDGARIHNGRGAEFLPKKDDGRIKPLTKDLLSRALYEEVRGGRGSEHGGVYFDVRHLSETILEGYPRFLERCRAANIDPKKTPLEVAPAHHHMMGGVQIDEQCRTSIPGLFAAGEVTGGVHGANRLAGNAATDVLVFGHRAGRFASAFALAQERTVEFGSDLEAGCQEMLSLIDPQANDAEALGDVLARLQETMWEKVGIERDGARLREAESEIRDLGTKVDHVRAKDIRSLLDLMEVKNAVLVASMVATPARIRTESRGDHYRTDFPFRDDLHWLKNIVVQSVNDRIDFSLCSRRLAEVGG